MKRKLNLILIPITLAVLGILYFQVDWMAKTYNAEINRINIETERALKKAVWQFKTEQRTRDSAYIYKTLKKWVDTVKMTYINNGDSLHIDLENAHKIIPYPTMKTGYYMRISLSGPDKVSIMSPSALSKGTLDDNTRSGNERNKRLDDSISKFFCLHPFIDKEQFVRQLTNTSRYQSFKADTARIFKYFKANIKRNNVIDLDKAKLWLTIAIRSSPHTSVPTHADISPNIFHELSYVGSLNEELHEFPNAQFFVMAIYLNQHNVVIMQIAPRITIAVILVLILILSFYYLIKIIKQQKQLADIKDDFIDNLTHEFKTPIATISAAIEGMQKFKALDDKEKTARYLEISKNELTRLNDMVTKLLNISVYDKNNLKLTLHHVDMVALIDDVVGMEQFRSVKPIKFTVHLDDAVKQIPADPLHFKNVLVNLVDNAVKYSKDSVEITIIGGREKNMACFTIRDNGIGIPSAELKHVFDKFYRVPTGDMHNIKGSGLGLSYVKSVIEAHGGTITVNSEINVKTEFVISIPLK
jgi:signal transduction histidine kinase